MVDAVLAAARAAGEDVWRLPMTEALKEQLKSDRADLKNTGERWGGAISAAHFLHAFAKETPWAHLDIAGPSHAGEGARLRRRRAAPASRSGRWSSSSAPGRLEALRPGHSSRSEV